jgi:mediator of RNA polymerase II transcription subunit 16, fungi type
VLIALATASKRLHVVEVILDWGTGRPEKTNPAGNLVLKPTLRERHIAVASLFDGDTSLVSPDLRREELSHLEIYPSTFVAGTPAPTWAPPLILSVRSHIQYPSSAFAPSQDHDQYQSIIDRWNVVTEKPHPLHSAFESLGIRNNASSASQASVSHLKKLEPIILNKIIVGIHTMHFGKTICLALHDGTLQYRDRITMEELYTTISPERVSVLNQVGFQQSEETPCMQELVKW